MAAHDVDMRTQLDLNKQILCPECLIGIRINRIMNRNKKEYKTLSHPDVKCSRRNLTLSVPESQYVVTKEKGEAYLQISPPACPQCSGVWKYQVLSCLLRVKFTHDNMTPPFLYGTGPLSQCRHERILPLAHFTVFI